MRCLFVYMQQYKNLIPAIAFLFFAYQLFV